MLLVAQSLCALVIVVHTNLFYGDVFLVLDLPDFFSSPTFYGASIFLPWEDTLADVTNIHTYHVNKWEMSVTY